MKRNVHYVLDLNGLATAVCYPNGEIKVSYRTRNLLTDQELEAVLTHEDCHIKQQHVIISMVIMQVIQFIVGRYLKKGGHSFFGRMMLKTLITMPISVCVTWTREFIADDYARRRGLGDELASALVKMEQNNYEVKPYLKYVRWMTHPSTNLRVKLLKRDGV